MESPVKRLREALGWNQVQLAAAIGRSHQSVQAYERGVRPPPDVIEKLKTLAVEHGLAGEIPISVLRGETQGSGKKDLDFPPYEAENSPHSDAREAYHRTLDLILDSGHQVAISAVIRNLYAFERLVRVDQKSAGALPKIRTVSRKKH